MIILFCSFHLFLVSLNTIRVFPQIYATSSGLKISDSQSTAKNFLNAKCVEVRQLKKYVDNWSLERHLTIHVRRKEPNRHFYLIMMGSPFSNQELWAQRQWYCFDIFIRGLKYLKYIFILYLFGLEIKPVFLFHNFLQSCISSLISLKQRSESKLLFNLFFLLLCPSMV